MMNHPIDVCYSSIKHHLSQLHTSRYRYFKKSESNIFQDSKHTRNREIRKKPDEYVELWTQNGGQESLPSSSHSRLNESYENRIANDVHSAV